MKCIVSLCVVMLALARVTDVIFDKHFDVYIYNFIKLLETIPKDIQFGKWNMKCPDLVHVYIQENL